MEQTIHLPNGVRAVYESAKSNVSYIGLFIHAGSRDERLKRTAGIMHVIEHLIFKKTTRHNYFELMNYIESVGGDMNAYTSKEETCIYISIQNQFLERAFEVLSEIFYHTEFVQEEFEKEREVIIDEINSYKDQPSEQIFDEFEELLFSGHELSHNILGSKESLRKITLADISAEYKRNYVNNRLMVSYVGAVEVKTIKTLLHTYFMEETPASTLQRAEFKQITQNFSKTKNLRTHQMHCMLGSIAPSMYSSKKTAMVLLNNLLGGVSFNSLLNLALREEQGLTYNIESNYVSYADTGVFSIYFGTDNAKLEQCKTTIFGIFKKLTSGEFTAAQLETYKQQLIGQVAMSFDNFSSLMISNAKSYMCYDKVDTYEEVVAKINAVTLETIQELAQELFFTNGISELIYK
ncbi:MAG: insulinase family protein [Bacteroidales bacterium]|jgi:predicted Zn-dependent peptidase|nr:insulinase family protein [Bacteroidales bacterium]